MLNPFDYHLNFHILPTFHLCHHLIFTLFWAARLYSKLASEQQDSIFQNFFVAFYQTVVQTISLKCTVFSQGFCDQIFSLSVMIKCCWLLLSKKGLFKIILNQAYIYVQLESNYKKLIFWVWNPFRQQKLQVLLLLVIRINVGYFCSIRF